MAKKATHKVVRVARGATINMGNYESARVDIEVELENVTLEEADQLVRRALGARLLELNVAPDKLAWYGAEE